MNDNRYLQGLEISWQSTGVCLNEVKSYEIDEDFFNSLEEESI